MTLEIRPLRPDDLTDLSRFLAEGFGAPAGADFAAPDVLRWKYLDPIAIDVGGGGGEAPRSFVACEGGGRIVGHVGACPTAFEGPGLPPRGVSTLHMIDWLGSREHRSVGTALMRQAQRGAETQYVLVANERARRVTRGAGYEPVAEVPVFRKVLRAGYRWKVPGHGPAGRLLRVARDAARMATNPGRSPRVAVELRRVSGFGPEAARILDDFRTRAVLTGRCPGRLNHALLFPRPGMSGWLILAEGDPRGFALLNVAGQGPVRAGKVVECLVEGQDAGLWHAAVSALAAELARQGADLAVAFGGTPWMALALRQSGFAESHRLEFTLRDRRGLIPRGAPFHLSPFEADSAYT
jgi:hypothetical protein